MGRFTLVDMPPALTAHVSREARLAFPRQGMTADVAFAAHDGRNVVVKRCAHRVYIEWLRREHRVLRALESSGLPIPRVLGYAESEANGATVGWLVTTRLPGRSFLEAIAAKSHPQQTVLLLRLGELLHRLHATPVPPALLEPGDWISRQLTEARENLAWCDGTAAGLARLERSRPGPVSERLIHGDLALDNVLVDGDGALWLIDWAGGASGDPRHDVALALHTKPEYELTRDAIAAFYSGYGSTPLDATTLRWFERLYDYF
jgi:aminoglycoside phosphotransferase (APT) family kinase protein